MKEKDRYVEYMISTGIFGVILINVFCNTFNLISGINYYRLILATEGIMIVSVFLLNKQARGFIIRIKKNQLLLLCVFIVSQAVAFGIASITLDINSYDIHKTVLIAGMVYVCYFASEKSQYSENQFYRLLDYLIIIGIFACTYNFIVNFKFFRLENLSLLMHYTWNFKSFFNTRSSYGILLSFAAISALVRSERKHMAGNLLLYTFFLLNTLITAARTEMIAIILGSSLYFICSKRYRRPFLVIGGFILLIITVSGMSDLMKDFGHLTNKYYIFFNHMQSSSGDISTGRFGMWKLAFESMGPYSFIFGHGAGSKDAYLTSVNYTVLNENLKSFHNGYIDMLFENGLLGLGIMFGTVFSVFKRVRKYCSPLIQSFYAAILMIVFLANMGDSNALVFTADTLSPLVTVLILTVPNALANYYCLKDKKAEEIPSGHFSKEYGKKLLKTAEVMD